MPTRTSPTSLARVTAAVLGVLLAAALLVPALRSHQPVPAGEETTDVTVGLRAAADNPVTPGDFTGYGFDQCLAPTQKAMNAWLNSSPFLAAGIYISGKSRACRDQPNLTPAWISTQLQNGWKLLPITLGPQASCSDRFPRYGDDPTIIPRPGAEGLYGKARRQARAEATTTVAEAKRLGIAAGSTLWYDLEAFDIGNTRCRESALAFLSAWTTGINKAGYKSGVYSSAGSGLKMLDDARVNRPDAFDFPDMIWIARWDGVANTSTSYLREDGWRPGARVKQYQGGHNETWGKVTINIDRDYLDVGRGSYAPQEDHCDGVNINFKTYRRLAPATSTFTPPEAQVRAVQCLLKERGRYDGKLNGVYNAATVAAVRAWQDARGFTPRDTFGSRDWVAIHMDSPNQVLKVGSAGGAVRRLQRALHAAGTTTTLGITGVYGPATASAVTAYQKAVGLSPTGIVNPRTNGRLDRGAH
ncbi:MAG TPA: glycoside hydrolase domain-containing protein [Nocardioides sp.]|nr:glycoside hydrolase domain-containing protein [Nocardioides sp.]